ncbi:MAG: DUF2179 domain-containing protein [Dehalococcoidia bacterium]|nr:DUF2179 domain-containing protein [Dehalococcoidia bacterium]
MPCSWWVLGSTSRAAPRPRSPDGGRVSPPRVRGTLAGWADVRPGEGVALDSDLPLYIPALIFLGRIADVSLGTIRMIMTIAGMRWWASTLGFVELVIWVLAVGGVVNNLTNVLAIIAYAGGFAAGTVIGIWLEERIALGYRVLHIMNNDPMVSVSTHLRDHAYRVTRLEGMGLSGPVEIAVAVIRRRSLQSVTRLIEEVAPRAFVSVERADRPMGGMSVSGDPRTARWPWLWRSFRK